MHFHIICACIAVFCIIVVIVVLYTSRVKATPITKDKILARVHTENGIKIGEVYSINFAVKKSLVKIDGHFDMYPNSKIEIIKQTPL